MTPQELLKLCDAPNAPDGETPEHLLLTVFKKSIPRGNRISAVGRGKPFGRICNVKEADGGFDVVAVFKRAEMKELAHAAIAAQEEW